MAVTIPYFCPRVKRGALLLSPKRVCCVRSPNPEKEKFMNPTLASAPDLSQEQIECRNIERVIRTLFAEDGLWHNYSIPTSRIIEVVRLIENYPFAAGLVQRTLTNLARAA
jgi:hypothetical protein